MRWWQNGCGQTDKQASKRASIRASLRACAQAYMHAYMRICCGDAVHAVLRQRMWTKAFRTQARRHASTYSTMARAACPINRMYVFRNINGCARATPESGRPRRTRRSLSIRRVRRQYVAEPPTRPAPLNVQTCRQFPSEMVRKQHRPTSAPNRCVAKELRRQRLKTNTDPPPWACRRIDS